MNSPRSLPKRSSPKLQALRQSGTFNARAKKVSDRMFRETSFFDPQDLPQVKYEMLRQVQRDALPISRAAARFGFSRPAFYKAQRDFTREGLVGLIPKRRGPKGGYKLTPEILAFAEQTRLLDPSLRMPELVRQIQKKFALQVHRRSLERALAATKKKQSRP
jgi:transposase